DWQSTPRSYGSFSMQGPRNEPETRAHECGPARLRVAKLPSPFRVRSVFPPWLPSAPLALWERGSELAPLALWERGRGEGLLPTSHLPLPDFSPRSPLYNYPIEVASSVRADFSTCAVSPCHDISSAV